MNKLIGLCGAKRSGKTEVGLQLRYHGYERQSMATPIRNMLLALGIPARYLYEDKAWPMPEFHSISGRHMLQTLGTEWGRDLIHPNLWVIAMRKVLTEDCLGKDIVIDDIRFANEVDLIKDLGGTMVHIQRSEAEAVTDEHESEQLYKTVEADVVICNNGTLDQLSEQVDVLVKQM